jgi:hypothetical protein
LREVPKARVRELLVDPPLNLGLIVNGIEADHALEEDMKLRVCLRVLRHFKEGAEDV